MTDHVIRNYMQYCYTCLDAYKCDTEKKCRACWEENGIAVDEEPKELTTEELLRLYAM